MSAQAGVYRYDQLIVLKETRMPAVLLEAGSIVNRTEELLLATPERQALVGAAVVEAVDAFCAARRPLSHKPAAAAHTSRSGRNGSAGFAIHSPRHHGDQVGGRDHRI